MDTPRRRRDDVGPEVEQALRAALDEGRLALAYQPIVELPGCRVMGVEALLRWSHDDADHRASDPGAAAPTPEELVAAAERGPLIRDLGAFVLERAFRDVVEAFPEPEDRILLSLNVSAAQLADDSVVDHVRGLLESSGWPPELLCLEITETVALADTEKAAGRLAQLRALGCRVALDDFGTGWSSLGLLRDLPVDVVKIDRSFVQDVHRSTTDAVLVRSILETAHVLGLRVCAEGVALPEQARQLTSMGCDRAQGWWFGRAVGAGAPLAAVAATGAHPGLATDQPPPLQLGERDQLVVLTGPDDVVRYASAGTLPLLGVPPSDLVGALFSSFLVEGPTGPGERTVQVHHADGHPHWLRLTTQQVAARPEEGAEEQVLHVAVDLTSAVLQQQALAESEERFRTAFDSAPSGMAINDMGGHYLRVNEAFAAVTGRTPDEVVGRTYAELTHPDDAGNDRAAVAELLEGSGQASVRKRYLHADGSAVPVELRVTLVRDASGRPDHVVVHVVRVG